MQGYKKFSVNLEEKYMLVTSVSLSNKCASINTSRAKRVANVQNNISFQGGSHRTSRGGKALVYVTAALASIAVLFGNIEPGKSKLDNSQATFLATYGSSGFEDCEKALKNLGSSKGVKGSLLKNVCGFRINR